MTKKVLFNIAGIAVIIYIFYYNACYINIGIGSPTKVKAFSVIAYLLILWLMAAAIKASGYSIGLSVLFSLYCIFLMIAICMKIQEFGIFVAPFYFSVLGIYELFEYENFIITTVVLLTIPIVMSMPLSLFKKYKGSLLREK